MIAEDLWRGPPAVEIWQTGFMYSFIFLELFDEKQGIFKPISKD